MPPKTNITQSVKTQSTTPMTPFKETNGKVEDTSASTTPSVADKVAASKEAHASVSPSSPKHQTHGAVFPSRGPVSSVSELLGRTVARGSVGSYNTLADYRSYLNTLTLGQLHRHAVEEAKIVPIDDRGRLIRRLEGEYTAIAAKTPNHPTRMQLVKPVGYSQEQMKKLEEITNGLLKR